MKDYYEILGVSPSSPSAEIRRVYRRLALQYHPDKNPAPEAEDIFQEINEAYEVLGEEENRRWYDLKRQNNYTGSVEKEQVYTEPKPSHRDPAYRRRKPQAPPVMSEKKERILFMQTYLPYIGWLTTAGLITLGVFILDFILPTVNATETVVWHDNDIDNRMPSFTVKTTGLHSMRIYNGGAFLKPGLEVDISYSPLLRVVFYIADHNRPEYHATSRGIYGPVFIFPLFLFATAIGGFYLRKNLEYFFNINIAIGILYILVIYFILNG